MALVHRSLHLPGGLAFQSAVVVLFLTIRPFGINGEEDASVMPAETLPSDKIKQAAMQAFKNMDEDGDGFIPLQPMQQVWKNLCGSSLSDDDFSGKFSQVLRASGALSVKYSQLIDFLYAKDSAGDGHHAEAIPAEEFGHEASVPCSTEAPKKEGSTGGATETTEAKKVEADGTTEESKKDEAEEGYAKVEEKLGGRAGIEKFAAKSQELEKEVKRRCQGEPWRQDY